MFFLVLNEVAYQSSLCLFLMIRMNREGRVLPLNTAAFSVTCDGYL